MREKITIKPGIPLFGIIILDCEVVVYLNISEKLLKNIVNKEATQLLWMHYL